MKKIILLLLPIVILVKPVQAQIVWSAYSQSYPSGLTDKASNIGIIAAITEENNSFWNAYPNQALRGALAKDSSFQKNRPTEFVAINTFDTAKAQFFLHGVNRANAVEYEFRVLNSDNKTIMPWTSITKFTDRAVITASTIPQMAYLGGYRAVLGDWLVVDVRRKRSGDILSSAVVARVPIKPVVSGIYTANELNIFLKRLARPWSYRLTPEEVNYWHSHYADDQLDATTGLPKKFIAGENENSLVFYLSAEIYNKKQLEYQLVRSNTVLMTWKENDFDNGFVWLRDLRPGEYVLNMRYSAQRQHVTSYPFKIRTPWYQSTWFEIAAWTLCAVFFAFNVVGIALVNQKRKTAKELSNKTKLQLELKAIYAQLNPHFVFNALSSIQGLINKQDIKGANNYLSDFARLMRETLTNGSNDQTSLKQELAILDTYLKLEQLRFGFKYEIGIDENIGVYETDVPSLLFQPLIENSVKHGVSGLDGEGLVSVNFKRTDKDMIVTITDNGPGFASNNITSGYGLKLTRDRITLLNQITKDQPITFEIKGNSPSGTKIYLTFKNWFL